MKLNFRKTLSKIHDLIPLGVRIKIGPYLAWINYILRIYILNKPYARVLSLKETINKVSENSLSVIRFGDGEMSLIENIDLGFQKNNSELSQKLKEILATDNPKLLICIPGIFGKLNNFAKHSYWFSLHHVFKHGHTWKKLLAKDYIYGDAFITRPYLTYKDSVRKNSGEIFNSLFMLWQDKDIVLIEGEKSRLGVGNNMFDNARSISRILCPAENAFSKYEEIKLEALKIDKNKLILLSLGPTAKVLAYDLFLLGYRVLDIGHIDMEYEMFLKGAKNLEPIKYKYFNEINTRNPEDCLDPKYLSQIIANIK